MTHTHTRTHTHTQHMTRGARAPQFEAAFYMRNFKGTRPGVLFRQYPGPWQVGNRKCFANAREWAWGQAVPGASAGLPGRRPAEGPHPPACQPATPPHQHTHTNINARDRFCVATPWTAQTCASCGLATSGRRCARWRRRFSRAAGGSGGGGYLCCPCLDRATSGPAYSRVKSF